VVGKNRKQMTIHSESSFPSRGRAKQIELTLSSPLQAAASLSRRAAWEAFGQQAGPELLAEADRLHGEAPPPLPDELYLIFSQTGSRGEFEIPYTLRRSRLTLFVLAEGITNRGRYVNAVERELEAILSEKSWIMPAHRGDPTRESEDIDLGVAARAACVAAAVSILKEKLPAELKERALQQLHRRAFKPYQRKIRGEDPSLCWWTSATHNWNAVCHAGILSAALEALPDVAERAEMVAAAEHNLAYYWQGFTDDGFCSEGLSYWNYGFGHFILLAETVLRATGGKVNWYQGEKVRQVAAFPDRLEMGPGVFPSFADCPLNSSPAGWIRAICRQRLFAAKGEEVLVPVRFSMVRPPLLYELAVTGFPLTAAERQEGGEAPELDPLRGWFPDAGVLVARSAARNPASLSVALKGGHNAEHHNHDDVGQFVVGVNGALPLPDPGMDVYTAKTFSPRRYENDMLNSRGHSVPVVAGRLQKTGEEAAARVVRVDFTPEQDNLVLDLAPAYDVPHLQTLERAFAYSRADRGSLTVTDRFVFAQPERFESALMTYGTVVREAPDVLLVGDEETPSARVRVKISTGGLPFVVEETVLKAVKPDPPRRVAVILADKAAQGSISFLIVPAGE